MLAQPESTTPGSKTSRIYIHIVFLFSQDLNQKSKIKNSFILYFDRSGLVPLTLRFFPYPNDRLSFAVGILGLFDSWMQIPCPF